MTRDEIAGRVHHYYWTEDINCATTVLRILSDEFTIPLHSQVTDAAVGIHGAGYYGAQCGLVEGSLMFIGIAGRQNSIPDDAVVSACRTFASGFEETFGSLLCSRLRLEGFQPDNPPHLCEELTNSAVEYTLDFLTSFLKNR